MALIVAAATCAAATGCLGPSDSDRIGQIRSDLVLFMEGKDRMQVVTHCPDDLSKMKITMESGGYVMEPESLDELDEALDEFRDAFSAETLELTQETVEIDGSSARVNLTFRLGDEGWEKLVPVRLDLERESGRWVIRGLHAFN
jgi:hypothetical protein